MAQTAGAVIRRARAAAGLTQAQLARRAGTTQPAIAKLESETSNPTMRTLLAVLDATGHELRLDLAPVRRSVDESLIRQQLELTPAQRLRNLETMYEEGRRLALAGARARGELA